MNAPLTKRVALIGFLFVFAPAVFAKSAWYARAWQSDDGLPNNDVTDLAQTPDGYLWVATPSRLARFDGSRFEEFYQNNFAEGYNQRISIIVGSRDGGLWLPLDRGPVVHLSSGSAQIVTNLPNLVVETAVEDGDGALWVSYRGGTLCRVKNGQVTSLSPGEGFSKAYGGCYLAKDKLGRVWFAKNGQISVWRKNRFDLVLEFPNQATRLCGASDGGVWICSGLEFFKCDETAHVKRLGTLKLEEPGASATALMEDHTGALWIGTSASGLFRYAGASFESVPTSHRSILSLLEDRENNLWVGTAGGGLNRIQPRAIELQGGDSGLTFEAMQSLAEDARGGVWAVTQSGLLICRTNDAWKIISTNADWPVGPIYCVTADRENGIWAAGRGRLFYLHDRNLRTWRAAEGLANHTIYGLLISARGDLWIAGDLLERLRNGVLAPVRLPPGVQMIRAMTEDRAGNIWLGTASGILLRVTDDEVFDETARTFGARDSIRCLRAAPDGSLWIGFATGGLGRLKDGKFFRVRVAQGLGDESISQILEDGRGWLWLGADCGIFKVREAELDALAAQKISRVQSIHYGRDEGLPSLQADFGRSPGALPGRDGRLWMPMRSALAIVDPTLQHDNFDPPPVLIKRVLADDQPIAAYGGLMPVGDIPDLRNAQAPLRLQPGHHRLEFEFTSLSFVAPENVQFRYRLTEVDEDWIDAKNQRSANYPRLPAGNYRFLVSACKSGGAWNARATEFDFVILPHFWETWWFRLAALSIFTACAILVGRYISFRRLRTRLRVLEQQAALDKERARIAKDIHDDLGGSLTHATLLIDLALRDGDKPEKAAGHLKQAGITVRHVTESVDEIVWAANPRNDTLHDLLDYISLFAVQFLQAANIRCRIDSPEHLPNRTLSPEVRHSLFLVVKEALNNVVRHAGAAEVRLQINATDESLHVVISDDGKGFDGEPVNGSADGLRNMRQRMVEIGGECRIESRRGGGTRIAATYRWPSGKKF